MSAVPFIEAYYSQMEESLRRHEEKKIMDALNDLTKISKKDNIQAWKDIIKENSNNGNNSSRELNEQDSRTLRLEYS